MTVFVCIVWQHVHLRQPLDINRKNPSVSQMKKGVRHAACTSSLPSEKHAPKKTKQRSADSMQWSVSEQKTMIASVVVKLLNPYLKNKKIASKVKPCYMHASFENHTLYFIP